MHRFLLFGIMAPKASIADFHFIRNATKRRGATYNFKEGGSVQVRFAIVFFKTLLREPPFRNSKFAERNFAHRKAFLRAPHQQVRSRWNFLFQNTKRRIIAITRINRVIRQNAEFHGIHAFRSYTHFHRIELCQIKNAGRSFVHRLQVKADTRVRKSLARMDNHRRGQERIRHLNFACRESTDSAIVQWENFKSPLREKLHHHFPTA